jgi:hypothetical protein
MLPREVMGILALGILWVNTLLIAAMALKESGKLARLRSSLGNVGRGRVLSGDGPQGALFAFEVTQRGRLGASLPPRILFHDRAHSQVVYGGSVALQDGRHIAIPSGSNLEIWIDDASFQDAARCPSDAAFAGASAEARTARGYERKVSAAISVDQEVFVQTPPDAEMPIGARPIVATLDPRAWLSTRVAFARAFALGELTLAGVCTFLSLHAPRFGVVSTIGGAASLVFFLMVQPAGALVRDALRIPSLALRTSVWTRGRRGAGLRERARFTRT